MKLPRSFLVLASLAATAALGLGATGCTATASAPSSCGPDDTVVCLDGAGYSCIDGDRPDDTDSSIVCSSGREGNAGALLYCCLHAAAPSSASSCGPDRTVVGCAPGSFGFSCADSSEPPSASYPSLTCSSPIAGNAGSALYCCTD